MTTHLFDPGPPALTFDHVESVSDSPDVRRRKRNEALIANGIHPTTRVLLRQPVGQETCGTCKHTFAHTISKTYWKCRLVRMTHGPGTDVKKKRPACEKWEAQA